MVRSVAILGTRGYPSFYGGFETAVRHLAPYLAAEGWDVTVYGRHDSTVEDHPDRDAAVKTVETWGLQTRSLSTLSYGFSSTVHASRQKPNVALVMNVANGYWLPMLRRAGVPTLVNVDGMEWERAKWGAFAKGVFKTGARKTAKHADELAHDAEEIGRRWQLDFGRRGLFIPYGGTAPTRQLPIEPGLEKRQYVVFVARFVPENSFEEFLEAAEDLATDTDVVMVGSSGYGGAYEDAASDLARRKPRFRWLGHIQDDERLSSLWQNAGVYFHGHSVGGTNPALVQAMASGAPIVARDTVFNREVLAGSGVFTAADPAAIAATIRAVLGSPEHQAQLSTAAMTRAAESYSWRGVCETYSAALNEIARQ